MAEVAGYGGSVTFPGLTAGVKAWSKDGAADMLPTTDYSDDGHKTFIGGCDGWTASCELNWDAANTVKEGDSGELVLLVGDPTPNYTGDVLVASISVSSVVEGLVTATVSFQGTGPYIYNAA
jgi:hypothetical protein